MFHAWVYCYHVPWPDNAKWLDGDETANILIQKGFATKEGDEPKEKKKTTKKSAKK